jgi:hypothetical protein
MIVSNNIIMLIELEGLTTTFAKRQFKSEFLNYPIAIYPIQFHEQF